MKTIKSLAIILFSLIAIFLGLAKMGLIGGSSYGTRIPFVRGEVFYTENVEESEAKSLVEFLDAEFADVENTISFQLDRREQDYLVRMSSQPMAWETSDLDVSFEAMEFLLQMQAFPGKNVVFEICDTSMKTRKVFDKIPLETEVASADQTDTAE